MRLSKNTSIRLLDWNCEPIWKIKHPEKYVAKINGVLTHVFMACLGLLLSELLHVYSPPSIIVTLRWFGCEQSVAYWLVQFWSISILKKYFMNVSFFSIHPVFTNVFKVCIIFGLLLSELYYNTHHPLYSDIAMVRLRAVRCRYPAKPNLWSVAGF